MWRRGTQSRKNHGPNGGPMIDIPWPICPTEEISASYGTHNTVVYWTQILPDNFAYMSGAQRRYGSGPKNKGPVPWRIWVRTQTPKRVWGPVPKIWVRTQMRYGTGPLFCDQTHNILGPVPYIWVRTQNILGSFCHGKHVLKSTFFIASITKTCTYLRNLTASSRAFHVELSGFNGQGCIPTRSRLIVDTNKQAHNGFFHRRSSGFAIAQPEMFNELPSFSYQ